MPAAVPPRKGQDHTKEFMDWKCKLVFPKTQDNSSAGNHFSEIASFISKWTSKEGVSRVLLVKSGIVLISCGLQVYIQVKFSTWIYIFVVV